MDGPVRLRRPTIESSERVVEEETTVPAQYSAPEALGLSFSKKSKKKSKISATRAVFEED